MQTKVELTSVEKFKPIEVTISLKIETPLELLELLEDETVIGSSGHVCNGEGELLSDVTREVVGSLIKKVSEAFE